MPELLARKGGLHKYFVPPAKDGPFTGNHPFLTSEPHHNTKKLFVTKKVLKLLLILSMKVKIHIPIPPWGYLQK